MFYKHRCFRLHFVIDKMIAFHKNVFSYHQNIKLILKSLQNVRCMAM